ncbi:MAG TPA: TetR/AcrR family transcriptional regulator [Thermomicrobiales bacterium]|nr:TetR/AcrR family transcriptional regulator [Thermomicrobiales bacterium]
MTDTKPTPNRRSERSRQAILGATRELLAEDGGVRALTVEAVAARAGVGKTTIYRRWRDKWELALDAVMIDMLPRFANPIDVSDTRKELITFVDSVTKLWASPPYGPVMQGLISQIATEPELARVYRDQVVEPRREQLRPVIERGIARGDLRPDADVRLVHELLVGPILYRLLLSGPPLDRKLTTSLADAVLDSFKPRTAEGPRRKRPSRR